MPICRSSYYHNSECSRSARRIKLLLKVVMVVSKSQYVWVKNTDAPRQEFTLPRIRLAHLHDHKTCGGEENPADEDGREMDRRECDKEEQDK